MDFTLPTLLKSQNKKYYAGIGSRRTPDNILSLNYRKSFGSILESKKLFTVIKNKWVNSKIRWGLFLGLG